MFTGRLNPDAQLRMNLPSAIATHILIESEVVYPCLPESSKKSE